MRKSLKQQHPTALKLRDVRLELGLTIAQAAKLTGVPFNIYYRADAYGFVSGKNVMLIEEAYQILLERFAQKLTRAGE